MSSKEEASRWTSLDRLNETNKLLKHFDLKTILEIKNKSYLLLVLQSL